MNRSIHPRMASFLDAKLKENGLAQQAIADKDARTLFRLAMECLVGTREATGNNDGPIIELMQRTLGGADKEPWCMCVVQTCIAYAELKTGLKSPIFASEHCMTVWRETLPEFRVKTLPNVGAIPIWNHEGTDSGHTGVTCTAVINRKWRGAEGNTKGVDPDGNIVREGNGMFFTERSLDGAGRMKLKGFLKPF